MVLTVSYAATSTLKRKCMVCTFGSNGNTLKGEDLLQNYLRQKIHSIDLKHMDFCRTLFATNVAYPLKVPPFLVVPVLHLASKIFVLYRM